MRKHALPQDMPRWRAALRREAADHAGMLIAAVLFALVLVAVFA